MIRKNPFYILDIPMSAGGRQIYAAAEELSLLEDPAECEDAASTLINPIKRLAAELDWFPECDEPVISSIRESVSSGKAVDVGGLSEIRGISMVNAEVYNMQLRNGSSEADAGALSGADAARQILALDYALRGCGLADVLDAVNEKRRAAGITLADSADLAAALADKRSRMVSEITKMLTLLDDEEYVTAASLMAEQLREDPASSVGSVLPGLIDRYELQEQHLIQTQTEILLKAAFRLELLAMVFDIPGRLREFTARIEEWLRYVGPLITVAALRGTENKMVADAAMDVRDLVRIISKAKYELTAYKFARILREYFADMPSVTEVLDRDIENATSFIRNVYHKTPEEFEARKWKGRSKI
ncbi:MAG: hypothetical protein IJJ31_00325 [Mogibacterium sp.]|nr:hypothetical protein [Mogibacterium sp.]